MKKVVALLVVGLMSLAFVGSSLAGDNAAASQNIKIAVVDLARALNEVDEGKNAKAGLEKEFKAKKVELDNIKNALTSLRDDLEKKSQLLAQDALKSKQEEYQRKFMDYQQKAKDYTEELARKESEITSKIVGKLRTAVETIASRDGYNFVFEKSQGAVVVGPANADITDQVIKQYK